MAEHNRNQRRADYAELLNALPSLSIERASILEALADQNVVHVKRLPMKGHPEIFSENVILTFSSPIPDRVKIAAISYRVKQSIPSPFRCKKCWHLGHSTTRCSRSGIKPANAQRAGWLLVSPENSRLPSVPRKWKPHAGTT